MVRAQRWITDHSLSRRNALGDALYRVCRSLYRAAIRPFRRMSAETRMVDGGNWSGNDSCWRMAADLAKIFFFMAGDGTFRSVPARRMFCLVDGVIGGDGQGPLAPDPVASGCVVAGVNPLAVDMAATRLMGFDVEKIRQLGIRSLPDWDFGVRTPRDLQIAVDGQPVEAERFFSPAWSPPVPAFRPHPGWVGQIEMK